MRRRGGWEGKQKGGRGPKFIWRTRKCLSLAISFDISMPDPRWNLKDCTEAIEFAPLLLSKFSQRRSRCEIVRPWVWRKNGCGYGYRATLGTKSELWGVRETVSLGGSSRNFGIEDRIESSKLVRMRGPKLKSSVNAALQSASPLLHSSSKSLQSRPMLSILIKKQAPFIYFTQTDLRKQETKSNWKFNRDGVSKKSSCSLPQSHLFCFKKNRDRDKLGFGESSL